MKQWIRLISILVIILLVIILIKSFWSSLSPNNSMETSSRKILYWVAPMDPNFRRDESGKSPMGMDLVPVYADQQATEKGIVNISPDVENNLGVTTTQVEKMDISRLIDTVGYVTADENYIEHIHTYTDGWIKNLHVKTTGEVVKPGDLLMELYSPTLSNAQEELLIALKNNNRALIEAGEKKLLTLGMEQMQINQLKAKRKMMERVKIHATKGGIVSKLNVREGMYIKPDIDVMTLEDLTQIWVIAEVFERQADWVSTGEPTIATLPYLPGKTWEGVVDYVYPQLNQETHTLRVRLTFPNPDLTLKPNMYANIKISSQMIKNTLVIPRGTLIRTGDGDRVVIALGNGRYKAKAIRVGIESGDYYQVLSGLKLGDRIVTNAQFLIDSESNLKAGFSRLHHTHGESTSQENMHASQEYIGMGKVKSVNMKKRTVSLFHQAIPALNMPAMTMELPVTDNINLNKTKSGDEIHFVIIRRNGDQYLITKIHIIKKTNHNH